VALAALKLEPHFLYLLAQLTLLQLAPVVVQTLTDQTPVLVLWFHQLVAVKVARLLSLIREAVAQEAVASIPAVGLVHPVRVTMAVQAAILIMLAAVAALAQLAAMVIRQTQAVAAVMA
jgi:hypothetical protein